jgi:hypothetical protein
MVFLPIKGRLHGAFSMCVFMSDKPFDAEAYNIGGHASATNGLSDMKTHIENAPCNRPLTEPLCPPLSLTRVRSIAMTNCVTQFSDRRCHPGIKFLYLVALPLS